MIRFHTHPRRQPSGKQGAMLLEVLLAVGIFACGVVGMAICLERAMETVNNNRKTALIRQELQTRLDDLRQNRLAVENKKEDPDALGVQYVHDISILQIQSDRKALLNNLYDVKVTATWKEGSEDRERVAEVYVYQP